VYSLWHIGQGDNIEGYEAVDIWGIGGKINAYKIQKKIVHLGVRDERMWLGKGKCSECNSGHGREQSNCVCRCYCTVGAYLNIINFIH
jgi:hypothetical protein